MMPEDVARLIVRAADEIRECAVSGEHPAAAEGAVRRAYGKVHAHGPQDLLEPLASAVAKCERAGAVFGMNPEAAAELLAAASARLAPLAIRAEERLKAEECFC